MDRSKVVKELREKYLSAKFPRDIGVTDEGNCRRIKVPLSGVVGNMQDDLSSFEAWILILKQNRQNLQFLLTWDSPIPGPDGEINKVQRQHYQRFLYRVHKFQMIFGNWFSVDPANTDDLEDFVRLSSQEENFIVNMPHAKEIVQAPGKCEAAIEKEFEQRYKKGKNLCWFSDLKSLDRQLPVGLFQGKVCSDNAFFPRGKSAIDLWGMDSDNALCIYELKCPGNLSVGIISELFFYAHFVDDLVKGKFKYPAETRKISAEKNRINNIDCLRGDPRSVLNDQKPQRVKAVFLVNRLHPLLQVNIDNLIKFINDAHQRTDIVFYVQYYPQGEQFIIKLKDTEKRKKTEKCRLCPLL